MPRFLVLHALISFSEAMNTQTALLSMNKYFWDVLWAQNMGHNNNIHLWHRPQVCDWEARWDAEWEYWEHKQIVFILSSSPESGRSTMNPIERRKRSNWKTMQNFQIENFQSVSSAPEYYFSPFSDWRTTKICLYFFFVKNGFALKGI